MPACENNVVDHTRSDIDISGVLFVNDGRVLVLRKRGASRFTLPGGKRETGESAVEAALREMGEEIGLDLRAEDLKHLGTVEGPAANEMGVTVRSTVFLCETVVPSAAYAEIEQMRWIDLMLQPDHPESEDVSNLLIAKILPLYRASCSRTTYSRDT